MLALSLTARTMSGRISSRPGGRAGHFRLGFRIVHLPAVAGGYRVIHLHIRLGLVVSVGEPIGIAVTDSRLFGFRLVLAVEVNQQRRPAILAVRPAPIAAPAPCARCSACDTRAGCNAFAPCHGTCPAPRGCAATVRYSPASLRIFIYPQAQLVRAPAVGLVRVHCPRNRSQVRGHVQAAHIRMTERDNVIQHVACTSC